MKRTATWAAALAALVCVGSLQAHHSGSMYETTPIWVKGTVVRFERVNPHTITMVDERSEDGQVHRWAVEGPSRSQLDRSGFDMDVQKVGDVIESCVFPYKPPAELSRMFPGVDFSNRRRPVDSDGSPLQFVAGHVLKMPDGQMRFWEPHGKLENCIRPDDQTQTWLNFVNTDSGAREAWCRSRALGRIASLAPKAVVDEIDRLMTYPCD